jgi:hypothetical protein
LQCFQSTRAEQGRHARMHSFEKKQRPGDWVKICRRTIYDILLAPSMFKSSTWVTCLKYLPWNTTSLRINLFAILCSTGVSLSASPSLSKFPLTLLSYARPFLISIIGFDAPFSALVSHTTAHVTFPRLAPQLCSYVDSEILANYAVSPLSLLPPSLHLLLLYLSHSSRLCH